MDQINLTSKITNDDFMLHIMSNLPEEYEAVLMDIEIYLMVRYPDKLTIEVLCENHPQGMNSSRPRKMRKLKKRRHYLLGRIGNSRMLVEPVVSMVTKQLNVQTRRGRTRKWKKIMKKNPFKYHFCGKIHHKIPAVKKIKLITMKSE